jgi:putative flavoprotein involved in K+ transport
MCQIAADQKALVEKRAGMPYAIACRTRVGRRMEARVTEEASIVIIGAGAAGLATAACLKQRGLQAMLLEASDSTGHSWARGYDALKLHTIRRFSGLPYYPMPRSYPLYPTRDQMVAYLADYASHFDIVPRTGQRVTRVTRDQDGWLISTAGGDAFRSRILVAATGIFDSPVLPKWPGIDRFEGSLEHTSSYRNGLPFAGKRVLIIGAGNSGAEIALDLVQHADSVAVAIRNGVNIVPLRLLGIPIQMWGLLILHLPPAVTRVISGVMLRRSEARLRKAGIPKSPEPILQSHGIPIIGLGLISAVASKAVSIKGAVASFDGGRTVTFADGGQELFDSVLLATGFSPALHYLDGVVGFDVRGFPRRDGGRSLDFPDLFFAGYNYGIAGTLHNICRDTPIIADQIVEMESAVTRTRGAGTVETPQK